MISRSTPPLPELEEIYTLIGHQMPFYSDKQSIAPSEWLTRIWPQSPEHKGAISHPRLSLFISHHGTADIASQAKSDSYIRQCASGSARLNHMVEIGNTDFRLYEMETNRPSGDPLNGQEALPPDDLIRAMAYGMMAVEPDIDLLAVSGFGAGSLESADALCSVHTGTRSSTENPTTTSLIKADNGQKGLKALQAIGGREIAALCGVILAAHMARIPVLLEGVSGLAALPVPVPLIFRPDFPLPDETGVESAYHISALRNELVLRRPQGKKLAS